MSKNPGLCSKPAIGQQARKSKYLDNARLGVSSNEHKTTCGTHDKAYQMFLKFLRIEYGYETEILNRQSDPPHTDLYEFIVKTPFEGFTIQIITDFCKRIETH